jgi:hypothetical protein
MSRFDVISIVDFLIHRLCALNRIVRILISILRPPRADLPPMETPWGGNLILNRQDAIESKHETTISIPFVLFAVCRDDAIRRHFKCLWIF